MNPVIKLVHLLQQTQKILEFALPILEQVVNFDLNNDGKIGK